MTANNILSQSGNIPTAGENHETIIIPSVCPALNPEFRPPGDLPSLVRDAMMLDCFEVSLTQQTAHPWSQADLILVSFK